MLLNLKTMKDKITGKADVSKIIQPKAFTRKSVYESVMKKVVNINDTYYVYLTMEEAEQLIIFDNGFQREDSSSKESIMKLAKDFDKNKCDAVWGVPHPEEFTISVVDGMHRVIATNIRKEGIVVKLIQGLSDDPEQRRIEEAFLFVTQNDRAENLRITQKHKANVLRGIKKYVVLDECLKDRKIVIDSHILKNLSDDLRDTMSDYRVLSGYSAALQAAALVNGRETLNNIFDIIEASGWRESASAYSANVIRTLKSILNLHNNDPKVVQAIINYFTPMEPMEFFARAYAKYPARREKERLCVLLEREVSKRMKQKPLYIGGDMRSVTSGHHNVKTA